MIAYLIIGTVALVVGGVPIVAIVTDHKQKKLKLQLQTIEKQLQLEQMKHETYIIETEKMRVELEHSKQLLLENKQ